MRFSGKDEKRTDRSFCHTFHSIDFYDILVSNTNKKKNEENKNKRIYRIVSSAGFDNKQSVGNVFCTVLLYFLVGTC